MLNTALSAAQAGSVWMTQSSLRRGLSPSPSVPNILIIKYVKLSHFVFPFISLLSLLAPTVLSFS